MPPRLLLVLCLAPAALAAATGPLEEGATTAPPSSAARVPGAAHGLGRPRQLSEEVPHKYPCIQIDADRYLPEWSCALEEASYADKQTVEYYLSVVTGSSINVGISCGFYLIDLAIAAIVHTWDFAGEAVTWVWDTGVKAVTTVWELIVDVYTTLWDVVVEALTWLWDAIVWITTEIWTSWFVAYLRWMVGIIPPMWEWWYVAVWDAMVIGALEAFVLLVVPAFIVYLAWVLVGAVVCTTVSIVLLILVPPIAVVFAVLTVILCCLFLIAATAVILVAAVVFLVVAILALIAIMLTVLIALVVLILTAVLAGIAIALLFVVSLVITVPALALFLILVGVVVCIIYALVIVAILAIMSVGMGVLAFAAVMLMAISAKFIAWRASGKTDDGEDIIKMVRGGEKKKLCLKVVEIVVFGISDTVFFIIDLLTAATAYRVLQTLSHEVLFPNLVDGGEIVDMVQAQTPAAIKELAALKALEDITYFIGTFAAFFADVMDFQCPGAAALVATSQLVMGCLFLYLIMVRDARSTISNMSVNAHRVRGGGIFADIATKTLLRVLEVFIAGPALVLLFVPHVRQTCDYVGDVVTAVCAYIYLAGASLLCCAVLPKIAFGVKPDNYEDDVPVMEKIIGMIDCESVNYAGRLICCTLGFWTPRALETLNGDERIKKDQIPGERRREMYNNVSIEFVAIIYQVLPLGGLLGKVMLACNEGFVLRARADGCLLGDVMTRSGSCLDELPDPVATNLDDSKGRFCGSYIPVFCKLIGYTKASFFIVVPLVSFDTKVHLFWFMIAVVWVGSVSEHIQPLDLVEDRPEIDHFTFDQGVKGIVESMSDTMSVFCSGAAVVAKNVAKKLLNIVTLPARAVLNLCDSCCRAAADPNSPLRQYLRWCCSGCFVACCLLLKMITLPSRFLWSLCQHCSKGGDDQAGVGAADPHGGAASAAPRRGAGDLGAAAAGAEFTVPEETSHIDGPTTPAFKGSLLETVEEHVFDVDDWVASEHEREPTTSAQDVFNKVGDNTAEDLQRHEAAGFGVGDHATPNVIAI